MDLFEIQYYIILLVCIFTFLITVSNFFFLHSLRDSFGMFEDRVDGDLVSVLIPARNEETKIGLSLAALVLQRYTPMEILVLDDDSGDNTLEIIRSFEQRDHRIRVIQGKELPDGWIGKNWACHQLFNEAKGDYIRLYREKWEYYGGKADAKVYVTKPFDLKVLKTDLSVYIESDDDIIDAENKIAYLQTVVKYIDGVIKSIDNRGWDIKNAITWKQFEAGMV